MTCMLKVTWEKFEPPGHHKIADIETGKTLQEWDFHVPVCDVCHLDDRDPHPLPMDREIPVIHGVFIVCHVGPYTHTLDEPFGLCSTCQHSMGIKHVSTEVDLEWFKLRWNEVWSREYKRLGYKWDPGRDTFHVKEGVETSRSNS